MTAVGVRKLKDHLSAYLRRARSGETVRITDRGEVVAELRPPEPLDAEESEYEQMVRDGKILPPSRRWTKSLVVQPSRKPLPQGTVDCVMSEDREDRG